MAIRVETSGAAGLYGKAALFAKREKERQREADRAESIRSQLQAITAQKEMAVLGETLRSAREKKEIENAAELQQTAIDWEKEKMQLRSRADFEAEERAREAEEKTRANILAQQREEAKFNAAMDLEERKRARMWELEKTELRSRTDFAEEERKRLQKEREIDNAIKQLYNNPIYAKLSPKQKEDAHRILEMRKYTTAPVFPKEKEEKISEADLARATKFLGEYEEPSWHGKAINKATFGAYGAEPPTKEEKLLKEHYEKLVETGLSRATSASSTPYSQSTPPRPKEVPADAFYEDGYWKIIKDNKKYKWVE